ncbi:hypothetical protein BHE74_00043382 [Ensete ventricosum]|nr:hypothetical protein BHE74_00043382 [Ensete ventricosum]
MKSDSGAGSGSEVPSATGASASVVAIGSTAEKGASVDEGSSLRKLLGSGASQVELKAKGPRAVAAYKASLGFESGLEKIGRINYEFRYRVALEQLRGKHPEIMIEQEPFVECPNDTNVEMDLNQPFDDSNPTEK